MAGGLTGTLRFHYSYLLLTVHSFFFLSFFLSLSLLFCYLSNFFFKSKVRQERVHVSLCGPQEPTSAKYLIVSFFYLSFFLFFFLSFFRSLSSPFLSFQIVLLIWLSIKKMAEFLLVDSSDDFVQLVATRSSFGNMKKNEDKVGPERREGEKRAR